MREVYQPILFGGQIEAVSCAKHLHSDLNKHVQDNLLGSGLNYLRVEGSSYLTVASINHSPYLLICGNQQSVAWSLPSLLTEPPKLFKCVGVFIYVLTAHNDLYKINTTDRSFTKTEDVFDFGGSGLDFTLMLQAQNVYSKGLNTYG